jgi:hypothetical protein
MKINLTYEQVRNLYGVCINVEGYPFYNNPKPDISSLARIQSDCCKLLSGNSGGELDISPDEADLTITAAFALFVAADSPGQVEFHCIMGCWPWDLAGLIEKLTKIRLAQN